MKKRAETNEILLIRSPFAAAGDFSTRWSHLLSALKSATPNLQVSDAAAEFMEKVIAHGNNRRTMEGAGDMDPVAVLEHLIDLDAALVSASKQYPPCLFHRHGFAHPGLTHEADLKPFANDSSGNPFYHYAHHLWQPFHILSPPAWALLFVETPGQMAPALTLAAAWRQRWPHIPLQWVGPVAGAGDKGVSRFSPSRVLRLDDQIDTADIRKVVDEFLKATEHLNKDRWGGLGRFDEHAPSPLIAEQMPEIVRDAVKQGCHFIQWQWHGGDIDATTKQLYAASRQGVWNHLNFDGKSPAGLIDFAAANANIVHSFGHREEPLSAFSDPVICFPSASPGYGRTRPMPGRPLWMSLGSPLSIRTLLTCYDPKTLMRLRVRDDARSLFEVGQRLSYSFKRPDDLPDGHLDEIVRMVEAGGSVNTRFVRHNLEKAYLIAYVEEEGVIVGNSSLKHPREEYIDAVSDQSGIDLHNFLERGYTSVRPEYRGLGVGVKLLEGLTERAGAYKIFSVIAESNIATQKMAIRNRTRRVATFYSQRANKEMSVWIPEWMLPDGVVLPEQPDPDADDRSGKDP